MSGTTGKRECRYALGNMASTNDYNHYLELMLEDENRQLGGDDEITLAHIKYADMDRNGLNILHLAIAKEDEQSVQRVCDILKDKINRSPEKEKFLNYEVCDKSDYLNQTYITRAVLVGNESVLRSLLEYEPELMYWENSMKDTVLHSCVKYIGGNGCPDSPRRSLMILLQRFKLNMDRLLIETNEDNLTPLQLAFFLGSPRAIKFLNDLSLKETERNLFLSNIDSYRITEIDTITSRIVRDRKARFGILERRYRSKEESCLDLVFHNQMTRRKALETIQTKPVYFLIQEKWKKYWILITIFALLHFFIMSLITIYSIDRLKCVQGRNETEDSNQHTCRTSSEHIVDRHRSSIVAMSMLILVYDILSLVLDIFLLVSRFIFKPCRRLFLHNIDYALLHIIFTSSLLVDFIVMNVSESYGGSIVIISLLSGWGFSTFFLRTFYNFGKLIDMIRHVLVKDVPRFLAIMTLLLVAFSASLQVLFKNIEIEGHESIGDTLYSMFMVTLGIREVDIYQTISSVVTAILIITYLILGHIILLNSLIAVMTTNSYNISQNDDAHQYLHRLSVILFIEDMFLMICYISPVGEMKCTQEREQKPVFVLKLNDSSNSERKGQ